MIILVRNIDRAVSREEIHSLFRKFGRVISCDLVMDPETGRSKGFGFVEMSSDKHATLAIHELNGLKIRTSELRVKKAAASSVKKRQQPRD